MGENGTVGPIIEGDVDDELAAQNVRTLLLEGRRKLLGPFHLH